MCAHQPACPTSDAQDRDAARVVAAHPEQGWSLLCNGVVLFDDDGELLPGGIAVAPPRLAAPRTAAGSTVRPVRPPLPRTPLPRPPQPPALAA